MYRKILDPLSLLIGEASYSGELSWHFCLSVVLGVLLACMYSSTFDNCKLGFAPSSYGKWSRHYVNRITGSQTVGHLCKFLPGAVFVSGNMCSNRDIRYLNRSPKHARKQSFLPRHVFPLRSGFTSLGID